MRTSKEHLTSLVITVGFLALLLPATAAACAPARGLAAVYPISPVPVRRRKRLYRRNKPSRCFSLVFPPIKSRISRIEMESIQVTPSLERDLRKLGATDHLIQLLKKLETSPPLLNPRPRPGRRIFPRY